MNAVIFVPYRPSSPEREQAWTFCLRKLQELELPIVVADSDGEWNRAQAINRCAEKVTGWDVALIVDADTVQESGEIMAALDTAYRESAAVVPWNLRYKLSAEGTKRYMESGTFTSADLDETDYTPTRLRVLFRGGTIAVSRAAWDAAEGFDERFVGWGHEDVAFRISCRMFAPGGLRETRGTLVHLWHERDEASKANDDLKRDYVRASNSRGRLAELMAR